jgi:hypothetical protein
MSHPLANIPHPSQVVVLVDEDNDWATVVDLDGNPLLADHVADVQEQLIQRFFTVDRRPYQEHPTEARKSSDPIVAGIVQKLYGSEDDVPPEAPVSPPEALPDLKRLGGTQRSTWYALKRHGTWYRGCDWCGHTPKETERLLDQLVARNLATAERIGHQGVLVYKVIPGALER